MKSNEIIFNLIGLIVHLTLSGFVHKGGSSREGFVFIEEFGDETSDNKWRNGRVRQSFTFNKKKRRRKSNCEDFGVPFPHLGQKLSAIICGDFEKCLMVFVVEI